VAISLKRQAEGFFYPSSPYPPVSLELAEALAREIEAQAPQRIVFMGSGRPGVLAACALAVPTAAVRVLDASSYWLDSKSFFDIEDSNIEQAHLATLSTPRRTLLPENVEFFDSAGEGYGNPRFLRDPDCVVFDLCAKEIALRIFERPLPRWIPYLFASPHVKPSRVILLMDIPGHNPLDIRRTLKNNGYKEIALSRPKSEGVRGLVVLRKET